VGLTVGSTPRAIADLNEIRIVSCSHPLYGLNDEVRNNAPVGGEPSYWLTAHAATARLLAAASIQSRFRGRPLMLRLPKLFRPGGPLPRHRGVGIIKA